MFKTFYFFFRFVKFDINLNRRYLQLYFATLAHTHCANDNLKLKLLKVQNKNKVAVKYDSQQRVP